MLHTPRAYRGMATAPHHLASQSGLGVLKDGGTAVEACVAMAASLAVAYPHMTGIGGDGFWLIAEPDGTVRAIDACGGAARAAAPSLYAGLPAIPWRGPLAANTVAGTVAGWECALSEDSGSLPLARLLHDAIEMAEDGVAVTKGGAETAWTKGDELRIQPGSYSAIFEPGGRPLREGERLRQPDLARTLSALARDGLDSFYRGGLARRISIDLIALGTPLDGDDLAAYQASTVEPLTLATRDGHLYNMPPPTQGAASLLILALFDRLEANSADGFDHVHGLVEATKRAFLWRDAHCGDPRHMTVDAQALLDDVGALDSMAASIDMTQALAWPHVPALGDTTWFGAADARGQVVSCIQSTYFEFGSGIVLPGTGITWQNRGSSFRLSRGGSNALEPRRKPFHTLNPAIARLKDGRLMAYGTMGGEGQPQTQAALFTRYARFGVPLQQAVSEPRWLLGRTWGEESTSLKLEGGFAPSLIDALAAAGHDVEVVPPLNAMMGHAGALVRHPGGLMEGATDPRSDGAVAAW